MQAHEEGRIAPWGTVAAKHRTCIYVTVNAGK